MDKFFMLLLTLPFLVLGASLGCLGYAMLDACFICGILMLSTSLGAFAVAGLGFCAVFKK